MEGDATVSAVAQQARMSRNLDAMLQTSQVKSARWRQRAARMIDHQDDQDYDSEESPEPEPPFPLPVPTIEGVNGSKPAKPNEDRLDPKLVGMSVGFKNLYAGREDRKGRFQWQETIPEDFVPPAENAETQKWAFIARYTKVHGDPRRTLVLHSLVIQSPLLKKVLKEVLAGYPNVTVGLHRLEFAGKFEALIHRFPELDSAINKLKKKLADDQQHTGSDKDLDMSGVSHGEQIYSDPEVQEINSKSDGHDPSLSVTKPEITTTSEIKTDIRPASPPQASKFELCLQHTVLLRDLLFNEFQVLLESSRDMMAQGVMTYEALWTMFEPGHLVYFREEGQDRVYNMLSANYGLDQKGNPVFWLKVRYIDFDGTKFGWRRVSISIADYQGTCPIASLAAYPINYHANEDALREMLVKRGSDVEALVGTHYRAYDGIGWRLDVNGHKERQPVKGRIIVDTVGWNHYIPNSAIFTSALDSKGYDRTAPSLRAMFLPTFGESLDNGCGGGMPLDGHFDDEEDLKKLPPLTDDQKVLCTHLIRGYALKEKMWLNFFVNSVQRVAFNSSAFQSLVLPEDTKELILGFTSTQQSTRMAYDDMIQGKGRGIILLLCGPPGVGKTLTAESVAEEMKVPLFVMSAGDLGMDSKHVEARLLTVLGMCTRWNAILLLDEADIFLEERSRHEVERNKLVSIFLRVLEYHEGIMFLTTNRVSTLDPAFQSRIHISINYPDLSPDSRRTVWENFLKRHNDAQEAFRLTPPRNPASSIRPTSADQEDQDEEAAKARREALTQPHAISKQEIRQLSLRKLNGRQIKNMLKAAQLLAISKAEPLQLKHINIVLGDAQYLHNASEATEHARSSIFN